MVRIKQTKVDVQLIAKDKLVCSGDFTANNVNHLQKLFAKFQNLSADHIFIDGAKINEMDTAGAVVLHQFAMTLRNKQYKEVSLVDFSKDHQEILHLVTIEEHEFIKEPRLPRLPSFLESVGRETHAKLREVWTYFNFIGQLLVTSSRSLFHLREIQIRGLLNAIADIGFYGIPIVGLLSFLVGIVLAFQIGTQLENYGANAYIVNLIGIAVLREFGPLITGIVGSGRTSSSITAQLGTMKINEELDALQTMGLSPMSLLVIPKILGALIAIPLLMVWADIAGILGGMVMTKYLYGMRFGDFLSRLQDVLDIPTFMVGMSKAPAFALIIAVVGCFQGLHVSLNADSIGRQTTKAVVQSLYLIIFADTIYAIVYSHLKI